MSDETLPTVQDVIVETTVVGTTTTVFEVKVDGKTEIGVDSSDPDLSTVVLGSTDTNTKIQLNGGVQFQYNNVTTGGPNYDILRTDYIVSIDSNSFTSATLPPISATDQGDAFVIIRNFASGPTFNLLTSGADTIDGLSSLPMAITGMRITVVSDGVSNWQPV